jgi:hypothetical protein
MDKRKSKGIEISHWKVCEADDFQGIMQEEYDDLVLVVPEDDDPDQRKEAARPTRNRRQPHSRKEG